MGGGIPIVSDVLGGLSGGSAEAAAPAVQVAPQQQAQEVIAGAQAAPATIQEPTSTETTAVTGRDVDAARRRTLTRRRTLLSGSSDKESILG